MKRIVILGDRICADYQPVLAANLKGEADVWLAPKEASTTVDLLIGVREYVLKRQPEIAVLASGILDTRKICFGEEERLISLTTYARNVRCALKLALEHSAAAVVWVTMSPVDLRKVEQVEEFGYDNETISSYNEEAKAVARALGVEVVDLYGIVKAASRADSCRPKGIRFDERSSDYLASKLAARFAEICAKV